MSNAVHAAKCIFRIGNLNSSQVIASIELFSDCNQDYMALDNDIGAGESMDCTLNNDVNTESFMVTHKKSRIRIRSVRTPK